MRLAILFAGLLMAAACDPVKVEGSGENAASPPATVAATPAVPAKPVIYPDGAIWAGPGGKELQRAEDNSRSYQLGAADESMTARFKDPVVAGQAVTASFVAWADTPIEAKVFFIRDCGSPKEDFASKVVSLTTVPQEITIEHVFSENFECTRINLIGKGALVHAAPAKLSKAAT